MESCEPASDEAVSGPALASKQEDREDCGLIYEGTGSHWHIPGSEHRVSQFREDVLGQANASFNFGAVAQRVVQHRAQVSE